MNKVLDFIFTFEGNQRDILMHLHHIILNNPGVTAKISYGIPFYYRKSWMCYLNPTKDNGVELCFTLGNELSNNQGILKSKGRKQVSGITYYEIKQIEESPILEILHEALLLDDEVPYKIKKKK